MPAPHCYCIFKYTSDVSTFKYTICLFWLTVMERFMMILVTVCWTFGTILHFYSITINNFISVLKDYTILIVLHFISISDCIYDNDSDAECSWNNNFIEDQTLVWTPTCENKRSHECWLQVNCCLFEMYN